MRNQSDDEADEIKWREAYERAIEMQQRLIAIRALGFIALVLMVIGAVWLIAVLSYG